MREHRPAPQPDRLKTAAYNELAELAVTTKTKVLRAEPEDRLVILNNYFQQSIIIMRRCGAAARISPDNLPFRRMTM